MTVERFPPADDGQRQPPRTGLLGRLAGTAVRNRGKVVLAWIAAFAAAFGLSAAFAGEFTNDYSAPGSDSQRAHQLLGDRFPSRATESVDVVVRAEDGLADLAVQAEVAALLSELRSLPHVA